MRAALVIVMSLGLVACGSDRALEEQRQSFEGQISSLQERVSSLEAERQDLQQELGTSLEEEYSFVTAQIADLQTQVAALEVRRDELQTELAAAGIEVPPSETGGQTGGAAELIEMLEGALGSGGVREGTGGAADVSGGLLETGGTSETRSEDEGAGETGGAN